MLQLVDWGKSAKNIQQFFEQLDTRLKDVPPPAPALVGVSPPVPLEATSGS
jgi:hypothetical protein